MSAGSDHVFHGFCQIIDHCRATGSGEDADRHASIAYVALASSLVEAIQDETLSDAQKLRRVRHVVAHSGEQLALKLCELVIEKN